MKYLHLLEAGLCCGLLGLCEASAITIDFSGLSGINGDPYTGHFEDGFVVTPTAGIYFEAQVFGNPPPDVFLRPSDSSLGSASAGTIEVTESTAGFFTFESFDLSSNSAATGTYSFIGWLNGVNVLSGAGGFGSINTFLTISSGDSLQVLDLLQITMTPGNGVTSMNIDNIVVDSAASPVPDEANTAVLLGLGLLGTLAIGARFSRINA